MVSLDARRAEGAVPPPGSGRGSAPGRGRKRVALVVAIAGVLVASALGLVAGLRGGGRPGPPPASVGIAEERAVPATVLDLPLLDQHGNATSLSALRGRVVVLTPFLTSCQETCPITTGLFLQMQRSVRAAGLGSEVAFVEVSVDPGRDTPARLSAYQHLTHADWPMLTGTSDNIAALWRYFGVFYQKVAEDTPPGLDWQSGRPYTYDVNHADGFMVLDRAQHLRFVTGAAPDARGQRLPAPLKAMLSAKGRRDLTTPSGGTWTISDGLQAIGWMTGRTVPEQG